MTATRIYLRTIGEEAELCELDERAPIVQAFELALHALETIEPWPVTDAWDSLHDRIRADQDRACDFSDEGLRYRLPTGDTLELTALDVGQLDTMTRGYTTAALWADCMPAEPTDEEVRVYAHDCVGDRDLNAATLEAARDRLRNNGESGGCEGLKPTAELTARHRLLCAQFMAANIADLRVYVENIDTSSDGDDPWAYAGHDFRLSSGGHGAGFFDRFDHHAPAHVREAADRLQDTSRAFEQSGDLYDRGDGYAESSC